MSRSIHSNRREYRDEFFGRKRPEELARIRADVERKRRIKRRVRDARRRPDEVGKTSPDTIPIEVRDEGPFVHFPAGPDDLRGLLRQLPPSSLEGLAGITLSLGAEDQRELAAVKEDDNHDNDPDPHVGRLGWEAPLPGVFTGLSLGQYAPWSNHIELFAYVFEPELPDREVFETYFRLRMLATFLHELAHHTFWMNHDRRARWTQEDHDRREDQVEELAGRWVADYAVPYLELTYPAELAAFRRWIEERGGAEVPLIWLASEWLSSSNGVKRAFFGTAGEALDALVQSVREGAEPTASRLGFARDLHYGEFFDEALRIIDGILAANPEHDEALTLQADIYVHQERYDEAERSIRRVLSRCPQSLEAWNVLTDLLLQGRRWNELWTAGLEAINRSGENRRRWLCERIFEKCVPAALHLSLYEPLDQLCGQYRNWRPDPFGNMVVGAVNALSHFWRHEHGAALAATSVLGDDVPITRWQYVLAAIRFETAHRIGRRKKAGTLPPNTDHYLRRLGLDVLADALVERLRV